MAVTREEAVRAYNNARAAGDFELARRIGDLLAGTGRLREIALAGVPKVEEEAGLFENIGAGLGAGAVGTLEMAALGGAAALEEEAELEARESIKSAFDYFRPESGDPEAISYKIAQAIGSIGGLAAIPIAASAAGAPGAAALGLGALAAAGAGAGEASERAREADATEEERGLVAGRGAFIGLLDVMPIARIFRLADLPKLNKALDKLSTTPAEKIQAAKKIEGFGNRILNMVKTGGYEAGQEAAANILQNANAREYDALAELVDVSTAEEAALGGTAGAIIQGLVDLFVPRKRGPSVGDSIDDGSIVPEQLDLFPDELAEARAAQQQPDLFPAELEQATREKIRRDEEFPPPAEEIDIEAIIASDKPIEDFTPAEIEALQAYDMRQRQGDLFATEEVVDTPAQRDFIEEQTQAQREAQERIEAEAKVPKLPPPTLVSTQDALTPSEVLAVSDALGIKLTAENAAKVAESGFNLTQAQADALAREREAVRADTPRQEVVDTRQRREEAAIREEARQEDVAANVQPDLFPFELQKARRETKEEPEVQELTTEVKNRVNFLINNSDKIPVKNYTEKDKEAVEIYRKFAVDNPIEGTDALLKKLRIPEGAAKRKEFSGANLALPAKRKALVSYARQKKTPAAARSAINEFLKEVPAKQKVLPITRGVEPKKFQDLEQFTRRKRRRVKATPLSAAVGTTTLMRRLNRAIDKAEDGKDFDTTDAAVLASGAMPKLRKNKRTGEITVTYPKEGDKAPEVRTMIERDGLFYATDRPDQQGTILGETRQEALTKLTKQRKSTRFQKEAAKAIETPLKEGERLEQARTRAAKKVTPVVEKKPTKKELAKQKTQARRRKEAAPDAFAQRKEYTTGRTREILDETLTESEKKYLAENIENDDVVSIFNDSKKFAASTRDADLKLIRSKVRDAISQASKEASQNYFLPASNSIKRIDRPYSSGVSKLLQENKLQDALFEISKESPDRFTKQIARKLGVLLRDTNVRIVKDMEASILDTVKTAARREQFKRAAEAENVELKDVPGIYDPASDTIILNEAKPEYYFVIHEAAHAATHATLRNPKSKAALRLKEIYEAVDKNKDQALDRFYALKDVDEFVVEAFVNPRFQVALSKIYPDGSNRNMWMRLMDWFKNLLGLKYKESAFSEVELLLNEIVSSSAKNRLAPVLPSLSDAKGLRQIADNARLNKPPNRRKFLADFKSLFGDRDDGPLKSVERKTLGALPNQAVQDIAVARGVPFAKEFFTSIENLRGALTNAEQNTRKKLQSVFEWSNKASEKTRKTWNDLVYDSTIDEVDPELTLQQAQKQYGKDTIDTAEGTKQLKIDRYKELRKIWLSDAMGNEGRQAYTKLRKFYRDEYNLLLRALKTRIEGLDVDGEMRQKLTDSFYVTLLENAKVEPYFPLTRSGDYWVAVRDPNNQSAEASAVFAFDTMGQRSRALDEFEKEGYTVEIFDPNDTKSFDNAPTGSFVSQIMQTLDNTGAPPEAKAQIVQLFLQSLPESSFARALIRRKKREGYDKDAVEAARIKAYDLARQVQRIKSSAEVDAIKYKIQKAVKGKSLARSAVVAEIEDRAAFALNPPADQLARATNRFAFFMTIGFNPSSALVNLSQIPLFAYPMLAGKYGFDTTGTQLKNAYSIFNGAPSTRTKETLFGGEEASPTVLKAFTQGGVKDAMDALQNNSLISIDNYYTFTRDDNGNLVYSLREDLFDTSKGNLTNEQKQELTARKKQLQNMLPLIEMASKRGHLSSSYIAETLGLAYSGKDISKTEKATAMSALMFHQAEMMNRQVALVASYNLELNKLTNNNPDKATLEQKKAAAEQAIYETQQINGGATLETGPRYARKQIGRVMLMYKNYGIQMYYTMLKTGYNFALAISKGNKEEASEAFRQLAGVFLSAFLFAGVQGIPIFGAAALLHDAFAEEYEEDARTKIRRMLNDDVLYKGLVSELTGLDVSQRIKLTDLLFEADRFNANPSPEETFIHYLGGPAVSVGMRMYEGFFNKLLSGDETLTERGFEDMLPGAVRNAYQALYRYPREGGIYSRRGDPIYDDITGGDLFAKILGFPPTAYTREQEETSAAKRMDNAAKNKRGSLMYRYYVASRFGDYETIRELTKEINKFNDSQAVRRDPKVRIDNKSIRKSMEAHKRTTRNDIHRGVTLSPYMKRSVEPEGFF